MPYIKQLGYTGTLSIPTKEGLKTFEFTKDLFASMVENFRLFRSLGMNVPVTTVHHTDKAEDTLGYVSALWEGKDRQGRDSLYCAIDFNDQPSTNVLNAGASVEAPAIFAVPKTGDILRYPLTAVAVTPTPMVPGMEPFDLALSLSQTEGEDSRVATPASTMNEQIIALLMEFLGIDPTAYEGKDAELIEKVSQALAALKKTPAEETTDGGQQTVVEEPAEAKTEPDEKDKVIEELQMSLNAMRQEARLAKLNALAKDGKLNKVAFDKAKAMYGGNLAMSRDKEFNDFCQILESNVPVANTASLTKAQVLPKDIGNVPDPMEAAQKTKYTKK